MIPNKFHFVYGFKQGDPFLLRHYLAVASAVKRCNPESATIWYHHKPIGEWWDRTLQLPGVVCEQVEPFTEFMGRPIRHYAHQSDIRRMIAVKEHGGIYLDIDTLVLKDLATLRNNECVMGVQAGRGLCNAVIMSEANGVFISRWLDEYKSFRATGETGRGYWDEHSVVLPYKLSKVPTLQGHITIFSDRSFFYPLWGQIDKLMSASNTHDFKHSWIVHLWETACERQLSVITEQWIASSNSCYAQFAKDVL